MRLLRKAVTVEEARQYIAQNAGPSGLNLYSLTDIGQKLDDTFVQQRAFPFDWNDHQVELFYDLMKKRSAQMWSGLDLKCIPIIILDPEINRLRVTYSLFKQMPKGANLTWSAYDVIGDAGIAPGPVTPGPPCPELLLPGTPPSVSPPLFQPLTQQLDPRQRNSIKKPPPFNLNVSTISIVKPDVSPCKSSTPESKPGQPSPKTSPLSSGSISFRRDRNRSLRRSPIIKARKRYSKSPKERRLERSRILDGEPPAKRTKLDRNRPKAKARRSLQRFLSNLFPC